MADKITYETIKEIMDERYPAVDTFDWYGVEIEVKKVIPLAFMISMVKKIADACFNKETGEYAPEVMNIALRLCTVEAYTNIELPEDPEEQNLLLFGTDLWDRITAFIDEDQLGTIELSVHRRVKARLDTNRAEFERAVNAVVESLTELGTQMNGLFGNITEEKFNALLDAVSAGGVDEQKLVQAVLGTQSSIINGADVIED